MFFKKRADSANTTVFLPPPPTVILPTTYFDGNDGNWSTFFINVGFDGENTNTGQNFRVIPSTSLPLTLLPGVASWCDSECAHGRGVEIFAAKQQSGFVSALSTAWQEKGLFNIPLFEDIQLYPDASPNGTAGTDNIGLGSANKASPILAAQFLVQSTSQDYYLGSFGLSDQAVNTGEGNVNSFLTVFNQNNLTASKSYGYTAGAHYRSNQSNGVFGNLVLGGYDRSRFSNQNITIPFKAKQGSGNSSPLVVGIESITYHPDQQIDPNSYSLTKDNSNFEATIDSTLPYLWLPDEVCSEFATRFQLTYDKTRNMYAVNATAHSNNIRSKANVVFTIRAGKTTDGSVSITLPYAAFDLVAEPPIFLNATNYFPIKKSPTGAFVIGRALLQEAYLIVDYERSQFQIAPATFSDPMPPSQLETIFTVGYTPPTSNTGGPNTNKSGGGGLSGGAIGGIVGGVLALLLLAGLGFFLWRKKQRREQQRLSEKSDPQEIDTTQAGTEVKYRRVSELDSNPPNSPKPSMGGYYGTEGKDTSPFPTINEMESPPAELYSPPPPGGETPRSERGERDYFTKPRRRGATRESSGNNTPGTPGVIHELSAENENGERVQASTTPGNPVHSRGPSDTSLNTGIDQVIADSREPSQAPPDRRPSMHTRGPSDAPTMQSDSTAVSEPTPEERERWAGEDEGGRRPLSQ